MVNIFVQMIANNLNANIFVFSGIVFVFFQFLLIIFNFHLFFRFNFRKSDFGKIKKNKILVCLGVDVNNPSLN